MWKYFNVSILFSILGMIAAFFVGHYYSGTSSGALRSVFIAFILSVLEISLSFDNAIVNAKIIEKMTPLWRRRFLTWGILIAVFGMRLIFPLAIVSILASINPWSALVLAATKPDQYAQLMLSAHVSVSAFGGAFLMMVALKYFYDETKDVHWISAIEKPMVKLGKIEAIEIAITILCLYFVSRYLPESDQLVFIKSGMAGLITFIAVDSLAALLEQKEEGTITNIHKASIGMFLYLEVLDASFSFDGVVGAFAITNNLFIIMIGLGVGAFYVRSITIYLVDKKTLSHFTYLEHGAFYAIWALAIIMLMNPIFHIAEWITGLLGGLLIILSFWSSLRKK